MQKVGRKNEAVWVDQYSRWQIKVQHDGIRKTFISHTEGKKGKVEAERQADKWLDAGGKKDNIRFGDLWQEFIESVDTGHSSGYKHQLEQMGRVWLLPRWRHRRVSSLTNKDYREAVAAPVHDRKKPLSEKTCKNVRGAITAVYGYAIADRVEMETPYKIPIPKGATEPEKRVMDPIDYNSLFRAGTTFLRGKEVSDFYINAYRFAALLGFRRGEVCGLKKADIINNVLTVKRAITQDLEETKGKTKKAIREIELPLAAIKILADQETMLKQAAVVSPWLFPDQTGARLNPRTLLKRWTRYQEYHQFNQRISFHEIRHTMVTDIIEDLPMPLLKDLVGHTEGMDTYQYRQKRKIDLTKTKEILDTHYAKLMEKTE